MAVWVQAATAAVAIAALLVSIASARYSRSQADIAKERLDHDLEPSFAATLEKSGLSGRWWLRLTASGSVDLDTVRVTVDPDSSVLTGLYAKPGGTPSREVAESPAPRGQVIQWLAQVNDWPRMHETDPQVVLSIASWAGERHWQRTMSADLIDPVRINDPRDQNSR